MSDRWREIDWDATPMLARIPKEARLSTHKRALAESVKIMKGNLERFKASGGEDDPPAPVAQEIAAELAEEWLDQNAHESLRGKTYAQLADHLSASAATAFNTLREMGYDAEDISERASRGEDEAEGIMLEAGFRPSEVTALKSIPDEARAGYRDLAQRLGTDKTLSAIAGHLPADRRTTSALQSVVAEGLAKVRPEDLHEAGIPTHARTSLLGQLVHLDGGAGLVEAEQRGEIDANTVSEGMLAAYERERAEDAERAKSPDDPRSWSSDKAASWLDEFGRREDEKATAAAKSDDLPSVAAMRRDLEKWEAEDRAKADAAEQSSFKRFFPDPQ